MGERELDLALALHILNRELGIGGKSNGSFLRAGLIDEISLGLCFAVGSGMALMEPAWQSSVTERGSAGSVRGTHGLQTRR